MAAYSFRTEWLVPAARDRVWEALYHVEEWPSWWDGVEYARELARGAEDGTGTEFEVAWRSVVPYDLAFRVRVTKVEAPHFMHGEAHGTLAGSGRWTLEPHDGGTRVVYEWDVNTTKPWMNLLEPIARPVFVWNHDRVMEAGRRGLESLLR